MDTPTSYYGTEACARFRRLESEIFAIEAQFPMGNATRQALYRARIELGQEEHAYRYQYAVAERAREDQEEFLG
jgi:hypothetical protein